MSEKIENKIRDKIREQLRPRNLVKNIVGHSTRFIVTTAVVKIIQPEKTTDKVRTTVGGYVIGSMVAEQTESYALRKFDEMRDDLEELKTEITNLSETSETPDTPTK